MTQPDTLNYDEIDPGIRETVRWLRSLGFDTTDSGDGKSKPRDPGEVLDFPHVFMVVKRPRWLVDEANVLRMLLHERGIPIQQQGPDASTPSIQANYDPGNGSATLMLMGVDDTMLIARNPT
jgi:hypothetical protein